MAVTDTHVIGDYTAAVTIDGATHFMLIQPGSSSTAYRKISRNVLLGVTGQPADLTTGQGFSNKVLDNTNVITIKDNLLTLQDGGDVTRQAQFQLSSITPGQTRIYTLPDATSTIANLTSAQTFTNKTLTSPVITGGSITGTTITTDAIVGQTSPTSGTVYGLSISSGKVGTNGVVTASITDSSVTASKVSTGFAVQVVSTDFSAVATGTTVIPVDDTIPQNIEGDQYMTQIITPKLATNTLVIEVKALVSSSSTNQTLVAALFQDSIANALVAATCYENTATGMHTIAFTHSMVAGTTSAITFKVRCGAPNAGTTTFNGQSSARRFGGITLSCITVTEVKV